MTAADRAAKLEFENIALRRVVEAARLVGCTDPIGGPHLSPCGECPGCVLRQKIRDLDLGRQ